MTYGNGLYEVENDICVICVKSIRSTKKNGRTYLKKKANFRELSSTINLSSTPKM